MVDPGVACGAPSDCAYRDAAHTRFGRLWQEHAEWSAATFGPDSLDLLRSALVHLRRETLEALAEEDGSAAQRVEIADCLLLVMAAARRSGMSPELLLDVAAGKLDACRAREWDGEEHVRQHRG